MPPNETQLAGGLDHGSGLLPLTSELGLSYKP